ncbi:MAG: SRPBCC domain-containing protein [Saprospiraceae bacterium]|nr:SRPBCC domain-containing protein [Saprospiraceae bacterium]
MDSKKTQDEPANFGIYHDLLINAPLQKVFQAISAPEHLINWWPQKCSGTPELGKEYNFQFTEKYDWYGRVSRILPDQSFHVRMTKSDEDWNSTAFGFELEEQNENTVVHFTHLDWSERNAHFRIASFCWAMLLKGLKDYVEKGIIVPFENRS